MRGAKIVVTGVTGQVGAPVARALATTNEVYGAARFTDGAARAALEAAGVRCVYIDLAEGDVSALPRDADYVLNFAVARTGQWGVDLDGNAGGVAWLMEHDRAARAFLHCSSTRVYRTREGEALHEDDALGDSGRGPSTVETSPISKIAAEALARWGARALRLPTTIARLNVPYGDNGGWPDHHLRMMRAGLTVPVHVDAPSTYQPIHEVDIVRTLGGLLAAADVPATVVNWAGDERVSIEEWCRYLSDITGLEAHLERTLRALPSVIVDLARLHGITGATTSVHWRDGILRMVQVRYPDLLRRGPLPQAHGDRHHQVGGQTPEASR